MKAQFDVIWTDIREKSIYFEKIKSSICPKPLWNVVFCHAHCCVWALSVVCLAHASLNFRNKYDYLYIINCHRSLSVCTHGGIDGALHILRLIYKRMWKVSLEKSNYAAAAAQLQLNLPELQSQNFCSLQPLSAALGCTWLQLWVRNCLLSHFYSWLPWFVEG